MFTIRWQVLQSCNRNWCSALQGLQQVLTAC